MAVKTDGKTINVAADEAAKEKADNALKRIRAGETFAALVAEMSDAPSKANGGLVGPLDGRPISTRASASSSIRSSPAA